MRKYEKNTVVFIDVTTAFEGSDAYPEMTTYIQEATAFGRSMYQYLKMRGCNKVYTNLIARPGIVRLSFAGGHANAKDIVEELTKIANENNYTIIDDPSPKKKEAETVETEEE